MLDANAQDDGGSKRHDGTSHDEREADPRAAPAETKPKRVSHGRPGDHDAEVLQQAHDGEKNGNLTVPGHLRQQALDAGVEALG